MVPDQLPQPAGPVGIEMNMLKYLDLDYMY